MPAVTVSSNPTPGGYASSSFAVDLTEVFKLAADLGPTGMVTKNIKSAAMKGLTRSSKIVKTALQKNTRVNDKHIRQMGKPLAGKKGLRYHPYSRARPMLGSLGHDPRLVHRLTQDMSNSVGIDGPVFTFTNDIYVDIGWDSKKDGKYIKYVVEGTVKMVPRDLLGMTIEQTQDRVLKILVDELDMNQIFSVAGGNLLFGGIYPV